jgi:hypothetical protein
MGHLGYPRVPRSKKSVNFQLVTRLAAQSVVTAKGTPWSRARVIRGFRAELKLQAQEARDIEK